jgi:hypothetical protein
MRDGRLSYGTPVSVDGRTVIPVTRVRVQEGAGSRVVDSVPLGFIEVAGDGSTFHPIEDTGGGGEHRFVRVAATAATTVVGALAGARALRFSRRSQRLLPAGRPRLHR